MKILSNNRVKDLSCLFQYKIKAFLQIYLYFSLWFRSDNDKINFLINIIIQSLKSYSCVENDYLETYEITPELHCKLAIAFYENNLYDLQRIYNELESELKQLSMEARDVNINNRQIRKEDFVYAKQEQRDVQSISQKQRELFESLKLFRKYLIIHEDQ